jgi:L-threonylcarbamoyladenylate synthase
VKYNTKLLSIKKIEDLEVAASLLKSGELVAVPTETVYGLAADAKNPEAVKKIFIAKNRPVDHPLIVHIAGYEKIDQWAKDISPLVSTLAQNFWPGPLTLLLHKADSVNSIVTGGLSTIALRVPANKALLDLLNMIDSGLAAPSANPHKKISPTTAQHVMSGLSGKIAAILDGGPCQIGVESTILDLTGSTPRILRPGPITQKMLEDILHVTVIVEKEHSEKVAGNMNIHYQPRTPMILMSLLQLEAYIALPENRDKKIAVMYYSDFKGQGNNYYQIKVPKDKNEYTRLMYTTMHDLDALKADVMLIETPPNNSEWLDVLDRLLKAASKK